MKQTKMLVNWLVACAMAFAMVTSATAQSVKERSGKVVRIKGHARYSTGNNVWQPLTLGALLKAGSIVQTAKDSFVDIALGEGDALTPPIAPGVGGAGGGARPRALQDVVRVTEDTVMGIDKLTTMDTGADTISETQLDLRSGKILGSVKKMSAASRYEVKIPNGVAGIRGTSYTISADGIVSVGSGSVVVSWMKADGTEGTQVLTEGDKFNIKTGELTKLTEAEKAEINRFEADTIVFVNVPTTFIIDQTVYTVSPRDEESAGSSSPPNGTPPDDNGEPGEG